jgi:hypothetical protein
MSEPKVEVTEEQLKIIRARLGIEAESFGKSHVGRYIYDCIDRDIEKFTRELIACDPGNVDENRRIRNDIHVRELFVIWIKEAISSGFNAEKELEMDAETDY